MSGHLAILGASGHGKVIADTAALNPEWEAISFFDDAWPHISSKLPWPVVGNTKTLVDNLKQFSGVVIGIGNNAIRQQKHELLTKYGASIVCIFHPQAYISSRAEIGVGSVVFACAVVNIHSKIGLSTIINTAATVDHDCKLADFVHISPGAHLGGAVEVGDRSWIGIGSSVRHCIVIGSDVVVGSGSAVVKPINCDRIVVGVPAEPL